ncbi:BA14K family protein [Ciceribacter sp. RN22]|uniref:BA14K family protein n=1 Tax=Ciceribacter sp. RN22 TaxID=2954932 RepID=UPI0035B48A85
MTCLAIATSSVAAATLPAAPAAPATASDLDLVQWPPPPWYRPPPPWYYRPAPPPIWYRPAPPVYRRLPPPVYYLPSAHVRWCMNRYRSYNPRTDTYFGFDGRFHRCRSPYR